jgi:hypothetical protein
MVGRTPGFSRSHTFKSKCIQVEFINENVDHSHWIVFCLLPRASIGQNRQLVLPAGLAFIKASWWAKMISAPIEVNPGWSTSAPA